MIHVLVVDDDPSSLFLLEDLIGEWGYRVTTASSGEEAWTLLQQEDAPRVAVIDWIMPGINGPELIRRVKEDLQRPFVYLLLLTSKTESHDLVCGLDAGADDFLSKPVNAEELRSRLAVGARIVEYERKLREKEAAVRLECYRAITDLAEKRDNETGAHLKRLSLYCGLLGEELKLPRARIADLATFVPLHDIGKVGISDSILLAPRSLSADEFETMKTHTTLGYEILLGRPTLELAAEIAHSHHERWDGSGYPQGLAGEAIPLCARITAVADVYDALRSVRPYKAAWSHADAKALIESERGMHFDPRMVDAFLAAEQRFDEIAGEYVDEEELAAT